MLFEEKRSACGRLIDQRVLVGILKSMNIDRIQKIHAVQHIQKWLDQLIIRVLLWILHLNFGCLFVIDFHNDCLGGSRGQPDVKL